MGMTSQSALEDMAVGIHKTRQEGYAGESRDIRRRY